MQHKVNAIADGLADLMERFEAIHEDADLAPRRGDSRRLTRSMA